MNYCIPEWIGLKRLLILHNRQQGGFLRTACLMYRNEELIATTRLEF